MKTFYTHDQIRERWAYLLPGIREPAQRHFHFHPARPANLLVTLDSDTGEINVSAGTLGPLTWDPYTVMIHCAKSSLDSVRNIQRVGAECVIALPGVNLIHETWMTALCLPRGVNEATVARLTLFPSHLVRTPSIAECPVNYECVIEWYREQHSHYVAALRILGISFDEEVLAMAQDEAMHQYPVWEVDDIANEWGGDVERLGVLGDFLPAPMMRATSAWGSPVSEWLHDLYTVGELSTREYDIARSWLAEWDAISPPTSSRWGADLDSIPTQERPARREALKERITRLFELVVWEEWEPLHALLTGEAIGGDPASCEDAGSTAVDRNGSSRCE